MDIKKALKNLPHTPGVYIFTGTKGKVLYVGKASNLKKRVSSYFQKKHANPRIEALVKEIRGLDYIEMPGAAEALIYEAILIKEKKPKYNIEFRDDKSYPFLFLAVNEKFPGLYVTRGKEKEKGLYFGPYTSARTLRKAVSVIASIFSVRTCANLPKRACLKAHLGQCAAPCLGRISRREYAFLVRDLRLFLEGRKKDLLKHLSSRMKKASEKLDYEKALSLREKIEALSQMLKGRKPAYLPAKGLGELKEALALKALPARIEAFDISNVQGKEAVGSMVTFFSGQPRKDEYRRFRIKDVRDIDDYAMIREVIRRRYSRVLKEKLPFPDIIIIDGGRGHVGVASEELRKTGMPGVPIIGIAKEKEIIYTASSGLPLKIDRDSAGLKLVMRIRDEAHRFAISYHKLLRKKKMFGHA